MASESAAPETRLAREMPVAGRIDRALSEVSEGFDFLPCVTPTNGDEAWESFRESGFERRPELRYRPLPFDPDRLKSELYRLPLEEVEEPALMQLLRGKQEELDLQISMLRHRGTRRFFYGSLQLYGEPDDELQRVARLVLEELPPRRRGAARAASVDCHEMAAAARREIARYRAADERFRACVEVRDDVGSLMVTGDELLVPEGRYFARHRVEPLLHHEVGTHLLTHHNGACQPLRLLGSGLAGYDPIQEGLAVLAEYLCGGLTRSRLRLLAARVLASAGLVERRSFVDTFAFLVDDLGFGERQAFDVTVRVYRGGGLTKDMIYLRGLGRVIDYLEGGGDLDLLWVGKVALEQIAALERLAEIGLLEEPALRPRVLDSDNARPRLEKLRRGLSILDLAREVEH